MGITIDFDLLRKLERFKISPKGVYYGGRVGNRRSPGRGTGVEFADHKEYSIGDDIRYLDWNVYGRLEELFIKIFEQEEALPVYILLDTSGSMSVGNPSKFEFGAKLALALGYAGIANQDNVRVLQFANGVVTTSKPMSGKANVYEMMEFFNTQAAGTTSITEALKLFLAGNNIPGVAFLISDFLDQKGVTEGIQLLAGRKFGVYGIHLLAKEEEFVEISEDMELHDAETERTLKVPLRKDTLARYREFFLAHCDRLRFDLRHYGVHYLRIYTDSPLNEIIFNLFTKEGVLK
ncbi:MAG: DUF58 domain-containing protein [Candidatus Firestonebacteria bacterium]